MTEVHTSVHPPHENRQSLVGTSYYMAPEMLAGAGVYDHENVSAVIVLAVSCSKVTTHPQGIRCLATYGR